MRLDRIHLVGFKSFGEKAELTFHGGITAIVGPNGCGKSNISDAIGWALGEQSAKSLRGQKMEDVIFSGSDARPPLGFAEVSLHVTQLNGTPPAASGPHPRRVGLGAPSGETREVLVTRRLHRSGESEYLIDGSPARLRDIHDVFMDTGMGTKAYSIIEQGKIGLILSSKPTDRRTLIEEAAGITKYKARRRSAELKLEAAHQNLLRVNDIIYEVERQMISLKRQAAKARRFARLRDAMNHVDRILSVRRAREIESRLGALEAKLRAICDEDLRRSTCLTIAETYREAMGLHLLERERELADARDDLHGLEIALERLDHRIASDRRELSDLASRRAQLTSDLSGLEERLGPAAAELDRRRAEEGALSQELERASESAAASQREHTAASLALAEVEHDIESGRAELVHRISKIAALSNFLQGVVVNAEKVSAEILKLREELKEVEAEAVSLSGAEAVLGGELRAKREEGEKLARERAEIERELFLTREELSRTERDAASDRQELSGLSGRLHSLEGLVAARTHLGAGARNLLTAGDAGSLKLRGVVADFLEVDPRFERAAERFYGEALQRILVDETADALTASRYLENANLGRCDFLVTSLVKQLQSSAGAAAALESLREKTAGIVGLLSESIRFTNGSNGASSIGSTRGNGAAHGNGGAPLDGERLRASLPDAIVVESLPDALAAYEIVPAAAYVTLGGEVVSSPGVVSAGPGGPSEGLLSTRREIRELKESVSFISARLLTLESRARELDRARVSLEARVDALERDQHALEKELVGLDHRRKKLDEDVERNRRKMDVLASERSRSESERESLGAKRLEMESALAVEQETKVTIERRLQSQLAVLGEQRQAVERLQVRASDEASSVAALRERVQAARVNVDRLSEGVRELESRIRTAREELSRIDARDSGLRLDLEAAERELAVAARDRETLREKLLRLEEGASLMRRRLDETDQALKTRRRELDAVRADRAAAEVAVAREESERSHLVTTFEQAHGMSLADAASVLPPGDLQREPEALQAELEDLRERLDALGPVNLVAISEFTEHEERFGFLTKQRQDLLDSIHATTEAIRKIDVTSRQRFEAAFFEINRHFDVVFKQLFGGGRAGLSLIDETDLLESGIDISAQPPGKRLQNVLLLSGGEKALTAISLMFAIFRYKPSPFCLLDEVDAPLDDANLGRFLKMVAELKDETQFVIITHSRKTMEMADEMYGVTMEEPGVSKLVSVNFLDGRPLEPEAATV